MTARRIFHALGIGAALLGLAGLVVCLLLGTTTALTGFAVLAGAGAFTFIVASSSPASDGDGTGGGSEFGIDSGGGDGGDTGGDSGDGGGE